MQWTDEEKHGLSRLVPRIIGRCLTSKHMWCHFDPSTFDLAGTTEKLAEPLLNLVLQIKHLITQGAPASSEQIICMHEC